jgi:hypothetical protein
MPNDGDLRNLEAELARLRERFANAGQLAVEIAESAAHRENPVARDSRSPAISGTWKRDYAGVQKITMHLLF